MLKRGPTAARGYNLEEVKMEVLTRCFAIS